MIPYFLFILTVPSPASSTDHSASDNATSTDLSSDNLWRTIQPNGPVETIKTPVNPSKHAIQIQFPDSSSNDSTDSRTAHIEIKFYSTLEVPLHKTYHPNVSVIMYLETEGAMLKGRVHLLKGDSRCSKSFGSIVHAEDTITFTLTSLKFYTGSGVTIDLTEGNGCGIEGVGREEGSQYYLGVRYVEYRQTASSGTSQAMEFGIVSNECTTLPDNMVSDMELPVEIGSSVRAKCAEGHTNDAGRDSPLDLLCMGGQFGGQSPCMPDCTHLEPDLDIRGVELAEATFPINYGTKVAVKCVNETLELKGDTEIQCNGGSNFIFETKPRCEVDWKGLKVNAATDFIPYDPRNEMLQMRFFNESAVDSFYVVVFLYSEKLKRQLSSSAKSSDVIFALGDVMTEKLDSQSTARFLLTSLVEQYTKRHISYLASRHDATTSYLLSDGAQSSDKSQLLLGNFGAVMSLDLTGRDETDTAHFYLGNTVHVLKSAAMMRAARDKVHPIQWMKIAVHEHSTYSFYTETPTGNYPDIYYSVTKKEVPYKYQDCASLPVELELDHLTVGQEFPVKYGTKVKITCGDRGRFQLKGDTLITCNERTNFSYTVKPWCTSDWKKFAFQNGVSEMMPFHPREEALQFGFEEDFLSGNGFTMIIDLIGDAKLSPIATVKLISKLDLLTIEGRINSDSNSRWTVHDPTIVLQKGIKRKRDLLPYVGESLKLDFTRDNIYWVGSQASIPFSEKLDEQQFANFRRFTNLTHGIPEKTINCVRLSFIPDGNPSITREFYYTVTKKVCPKIPDGVEADHEAPVSHDTVVVYSCPAWYEPSVEDGQLKCKGDYYVNPKNLTHVITQPLCQAVAMGELGIWLTIIITIALSVGGIVGASRYWRRQNLKKEEDRVREEGEGGGVKQGEEQGGEQGEGETGQEKGAEEGENGNVV